MRPALLAVTTLSCALVALAIACGDDGNATPTPTRIAVITGGPETVTPAPGSPDHKTAPPSQTAPASGAAETPEGATPTPPPPAAEGTPAVAPANEAVFLAQFQGQTITQETCVYNPATVLTDCAAYGIYAIDPPIAGQDVNCTLLLVSGVARAVQCTTVEPQQSKTYEIK